MSTSKSFWDAPILSSRTDPLRVTLPEMIFGYFTGPLLVLAMTSIVSSYYLTFYRTYDDVVAQGSFLVLLPLLSVIPMTISNIIVGLVLGKTRTRQGKARPFILTAAPLLLLSGLVMFIIPYLSLGFRMAWMAITFNLFASLANPIYGSAHYLMVSLSTRDLAQRGKLSVVANIPAVAGNGLFGSILMPLLLSWINSAQPRNDIVQNRWQLVMGLFAIAAFIGCTLEYFFTRERITEEDISEDTAETHGEIIPTGKQLKAAVSDRYWWIIMIFYMLYQAGTMFKGGYVFNLFCHTFYGQGVSFMGMTLDADRVQSVLALLSGVPLAAGMLFAWPVASRIGKRNFLVLGCIVSVAGSVVCLLSPGSFPVLLLGQLLKGFSSIPGAYILMALFADVLDHLEARFGYRVDGVSMSVYNSIITIVNGLAVAIFNLFFDNPSLSQKGVAAFFFLGFEIIAHGVLIFLLQALTVERDIQREQALIAERKGV